MNLTRSIRPWSWWGAWSLALGASAARLEVEILPRFEGAPLVFDSLTYCTAAGQVISVTRLDFLVSNFALQRSGGSWLVLSDKQAYLSAREGRCQFVLPNIPIGRYERVRFLVGLTRDVNRREPSQYGADHPLNPNVNGLHWGWQGGYVFLALEGDWRDGATDRGYSFHVANEPQLMTVELPAPIEVTSAHLLRFTLDIGHIFAAPHCITLAQNSSTSHSRTNDILAAQLRENIEQAFAIESIAPTHLSETNPAPAAPLVASNAMRLVRCTKLRIPFFTFLP